MILSVGSYILINSHSELLSRRFNFIASDLAFLLPVLNAFDTLANTLEIYNLINYKKCIF